MKVWRLLSLSHLLLSLCTCAYHSNCSKWQCVKERVRIRRSRLVHIQKISAIFALNRTRSAAKGTELNYFVAVIITSHRIFTFPETCYIERTNSNGTARNVSKSRFYLISRAPPKYFSQQKARQVESFLPRLEGGYTIGCITG